MQQRDSSPPRLAEVMAALSLATDLGMSQPLEFALRSCILSLRLGEVLGFGESELREVYYQALLRYIGCTAETGLLASIAGDEMVLRANYVTVDPGHTREIVGLMIRTIRQANAGAAPLHMLRQLAHGLLSMTEARDSFASHCEVAQRLAERLGFEQRVVEALGQLYERWDGKGQPRGLRGEAIAPAVRLVSLAQDMITFERTSGRDGAVAVARERSGSAYDPKMADAFCRRAASLLAGLDDEPSWSAVLALEPGRRVVLTESEFNTACEAIADFADLKSTYTLGHSRGVAALAAEAARRCGLPAGDVRGIERAGLLHDVGRVGVSTGIWDKPGPLSEREWEHVRLHPYYTERVFARPAALAQLGALASHHHERLDGSGYHRGTIATGLSPAARILAAADVYQAMTEARPQRPAHNPEAAAAELRREARAGRLDSQAVDGVLAAAGHRVRASRRTYVAGLSEREIEVLRLVARGQSMKQIAASLFISEKTVDNHIQHIYAKSGVTTRAGATLFAIEQDLLADARTTIPK